MKEQIIKTGAAAVLSLFIISCGSKPGKDAPLKGDLELNYTETTVYNGRTMTKEIQITFTKAEGGMFKATKTTADQNGSYSDDLMVDGYFRYNKVMEYNVGGFDIWLDPEKLATGQIERLKIEERTFNGKEVYAALWTDKMTSYHDKVTGLQEGSETRLKNDGSQTVVRLD